ncbi:MAG: hypothetical protein B9S28_01000 [Opitutia bacterium Tous-C10FEB]|nr:MAG: hypothetical protein B9S28_01000 [Opitutae bacterium Tous-C10FEB]
MPADRCPRCIPAISSDRGRRSLGAMIEGGAVTLYRREVSRGWFMGQSNYNVNYPFKIVIIRIIPTHLSAKIFGPIEFLKETFRLFFSTKPPAFITAQPRPRWLLLWISARGVGSKLAASQEYDSWYPIRFYGLNRVLGVKKI